MSVTDEHPNQRALAREWLWARITIIGGFAIAIVVAIYFALGGAHLFTHQITPEEAAQARARANAQASLQLCSMALNAAKNFGIVPEYVLRIVPKRKDKYLLRGQIWVNASSFRIRRIEGVPAKSPSIWLKGIHITLQFAQLKGMWIPTSFDAIATVRLLGRYTLAGHNTRASQPQSIMPN